ncbi:DEAD/DEAH box helicase family protein [Methylovulum psychrotolerans]|uniref:DEAD/DEAH box helicase family protein n=1 Tax=Methylovulum psychrotolerans TaxID=1704499 RepID=UPI001BFFBD0D|nr:DEAD/DEAH box helicase family protein [Methylovulum psychrotolerans]MBT9098814.1 DEAD/DEAH box helicase family protein [Methylovulum psychrotolerans]
MINNFKKIDSLSSSDFEIFVRDVFVAAGWSDAIITKVGQEFQHGDGGVDIFAYKAKRKFAIEVKQRTVGITVDIKALNQLVTGAKLANVTNMILVTNSYFTSEVKVRALRLGVELIDRDALQNLWIEKHSEIGREIKPRTYQETVINDSVARFYGGKSRLLIEMATGLGKTYTVAHLVKRLLQQGKVKRVLFLAHQVEILLQSVTAFKNVLGIGTYSFSACFGGANPENTDFVFGSFDTLFSKIATMEKEMFDVVIVDEAHHTPASTYAMVVEHFHPKLLVGLTATPFREDNKDVLAFFGGSAGHVGKYDLAWALRHNKLAFPKYLVLLDDLDQSRIDQLDKGMSISDLDRRLFLHKKDEEVVRIIEKTVQDKQIQNLKGIVFCRNIAHIKYLIQFFPAGSATFVHSKMTDQQRWQNIRDFREGNYRYILVRDLFNEGVDIPETNLLVFMRYTGSHTVWLQQLGRGLRKTPNKDYVHVLDFVGSLERLSEVHQLTKRVNSIPIEKDNWEPSPRDKKETVHNSSLEVNYSQSAAQVLQLIEELQYRLKSRMQAIEVLRKYHRNYNNIPALNKVESVLADITADQIATHFDSYFGYLEAALTGQYDQSFFRNLCLDYAMQFYQQNNICPTFRAISLANQYNALLACSEPEVKFLIGNEGELESYLVGKNKLLETIYQVVADPIEITSSIKAMDTNVNEESLLISKYSAIIKTRQDLLTLSTEDRAEIKKVFKSEFRFLSCLQNKK